MPRAAVAASAIGGRYQKPYTGTMGTSIYVVLADSLPTQPIRLPSATSPPSVLPLAERIFRGQEVGQNFGDDLKAGVQLRKLLFD